ncbi:hypothetical protein KC950_04505 [Candidatus Saccharibacteria bacterium]|nr:hypothetical protein [Candidatus Saccharibacteria bacterium]
MRVGAGKNRNFLMLSPIIGLLVIFVGTSKVNAFTGDGNGTSDNPYKISSCEQLQEISDELSAHYALVENIDCSGTTAWNASAGFEPIGTSTSLTFSGVLDGRNRTIDSLFINRSGNNIGMFAFLSGTVKNLSMTNVDITSSSGTNHGSLVAEAIGATIEHVSVQGDFNGNQRVGGFVGFVRDGSIEDPAGLATSVVGSPNTGLRLQ